MAAKVTRVESLPSSHPDVRQAGWQKWSREHPDWYARRSTSTHPDWYNRERDTIRRSDYKCINWHYERPSKPTSRVHDHFIPRENDVMMKDVQKAMPHSKHYLGSLVTPSLTPWKCHPQSGDSTTPLITRNQRDLTTSPRLNTTAIEITLDFKYWIDIKVNIYFFPL